LAFLNPKKDSSAKTAELPFLKPWVSPKPDQLNQLDRNACRRWARGNKGLFPAHQALGLISLSTP